MTVIRGRKGRAEVSKVVCGGPAALAGVLEGDCVIGVGGLWLDGFEAFMSALPTSETYPVTLVFRRRGPTNMVRSPTRPVICNASLLHLLVIISYVYDPALAASFQIIYINQYRQAGL